jgi:glycosyltransferase involved in cell wall biosynthesis
MCAGIPVIASDLPGCREIVESSKCGLLVEPFNVRALSEAITYLWTHPQEALEMGQRGFEQIQRKYNWGEEEKNLFRVYERLCAVPGTASASEVRL